MYIHQQNTTWIHVLVLTLYFHFISRAQKRCHVSFKIIIINSSFSIFFQGSKKMFRSLVSLVIHHSVMAENLPCPLLIDHAGSWIRNSAGPCTAAHGSSCQAGQRAPGCPHGPADTSAGNGCAGLDNHSRDHDFADTDLDDYSNLVMTLRKSISSSTSDVSSLTSLD